MAAVWTKNEVLASKRRFTLLVTSWLDGSKAPRGTDFTGFVYIAKGTPDYVAFLGTLVNKRRPLTFAAAAFTADHTTEQFTLAGHNLETGDGPFTVSSDDTLPTGLAAATNYWIIRVDDDVFQLATSPEDAYAGTEVEIDDNGVGSHTLTGATPHRGIDGQWTGEATQAETNFDGAEAEIAILGHASYEAYTTVNMQGDDAWGGELESGHTRDDGLRLILRNLTAKFSKVGNVYTWRDLADTKDSHHGTVTSAGRIDAVIDDAT